MTRATFAAALAGFLLAACTPGGVQDPAAAGTTPDTALAADARPFPANTLEIVEVLAADSMQGRRSGTGGNAMARAFLETEMAARGLRPHAESYEHRFSFAGREGETVEGVNLIARIPGTLGSGPVLVVTAHYDHVGTRGEDIYNGADDNASGVAGTLAVADHFMANPPLHDVVIALLDAEEMGLQGARAFLADGIVEPGRIGLNVNFDMLSKNDRNELYAAGAFHTPALEPLLLAIADDAPVMLKLGHDDPALGPDDWTNQSDHGPFHAAGVPFVYFGVEDHPEYHQPTDVYETIPQDFFLRAVDTVVMATDRLDKQLGLIAGEAGSTGSGSSENEP